jgi:hypothetical protein
VDVALQDVALQDVVLQDVALRDVAPQDVAIGLTPRPKMLSSFALGTLAIFVVMAAWSVSMPLYSGPDEASHVIHAAALVRGQTIGTPVAGPQNPYTVVTVPGTFGHGSYLMRCYKFSPSVPASCGEATTLSAAPIRAQTYTGRYPPLYYAVVGLPTLASTSQWVVIWMRLLGALMCSALLGLALMAITLWSRARILPAGFLCALTPAAIYMGAMVNPNGLEIAAAICFWSAGIILALEHADDPPQGLVVVAAVSGCVLTLCRGLSPLWTILALAAFVVLMGRHRAWSLLKARRDVQWSAAALLVSGIVATIWILLAHTLWAVPVGKPDSLAQTPELHIVSQALKQTKTWLREMVGVMGWLDTRLPVWTYVAWGLASLALIVVGVWLGRLRTSIVLALIGLVALFLPVVLELNDARTVNLIWEGRYSLPLAVGVPLLAAASVGARAIYQRLQLNLARVVLVMLGVAGVLGYLQTLRRYAVGASGPVDFLHGTWQPIEGNAVAILWYVAGTVFLVGMLWRLTDRVVARSE